MLEFFSFIGTIILVMFALLLIVYILQGIFLTKFNKLVYGKSTPMAWIPLANDYLLGKLAFNKTVGWVLVILLFISRGMTSIIDEEVVNNTMFPKEVSIMFTSLMFFVMIFMYIYAIVKYTKLKRSKMSEQNNYYNQQ